MLKIGQIEYANCTPLFRVLRDYFSCSEYEFISGVPAELNRKLLAGKIDVCPSSSIEYAYHPERYSILPELSISSNGAVASVMLFSRIPIESLDGCVIRLSSESATSVNLLRILMSQHFGFTCSYEIVSPAADVAADASPALLLIGDSALKADDRHAPYVYDLGELWHLWTGYPFVFALWLCRNEVSEGAELKKLSRQLIEAKERVPGLLDQVAAGSKEVQWMGRDRLLTYWRDNISYHLDEKAQAGLLLFYAKCFECGLIAAVPVLKFVHNASDDRVTV